MGKEQYGENEDPYILLDSIFPHDSEVEDDITLGYPDHSNGLATRLLGQMDPEYRRAFYGLESRPIEPDQQLAHVVSLVDGYDRRDPDRRAKTAQDMVLEEIKLVATYFRALQELKSLPVPGWYQPLASNDSGRLVWCVAENPIHRRAQATFYSGDIEILRDYTLNPKENRSGFQLVTLRWLPNPED